MTLHRFLFLVCLLVPALAAAGERPPVALTGNARTDFFAVASPSLAPVTGQHTLLPLQEGMDDGAAGDDSKPRAVLRRLREKRCRGDRASCARHVADDEQRIAGNVLPKILGDHAGVDRVAALRYGVNDLQLFFQGDVRFLEQFA